MKIHVRQSKSGSWFYHILGDNGRILATSEQYASKGNAKRAANSLGDRINLTQVCVVAVVEPRIA